MEVIDIGLNDLEPVSLNLSGLDAPFRSSEPASSSSSLGPGIDLLMNNKHRSGSNSVNVDLRELDDLERELNSLSGLGTGGGSSLPEAPKPATAPASSLGGGFSNLFGGWGKPAAVQQTPLEPTDSNLGQATKDSSGTTGGTTKTWDGFGKFADIPTTGAGKQMTDRERKRKKKHMMRELDKWADRGLIKNVSRFTEDSTYEEIEDEYEAALEDKRRKDSVKLQQWWFMTFINSVEWANAAFNPFDLNLDGWGEQVSEDIDSYDEIFSELYDKYKGGKMAPELQLLLRIGFSAAMVNFTNKALSTATPGFNDVIKQSPQLMKMFTDATVNAMSQNSPAFQMAANMMNRPDEVNTSFGPPPAPVETKKAGSRMQFTEPPNNRQDINAARGTMFREQGVSVQNNFASANEQQQQRSFARPEMQGPRSDARPEMQGPGRPEMRGPALNPDLENILSGLKKAPAPAPVSQSRPITPNIENNIQAFTVEDVDDSMISISSLKDLQQNASIPKGNRRRKNGSDKNPNTIRLDI
jgi:hypothetical protein